MNIKLSEKEVEWIVDGLRAVYDRAEENYNYYSLKLKNEKEFGEFRSNIKFHKDEYEQQMIDLLRLRSRFDDYSSS